MPDLTTYMIVPRRTQPCLPCFGRSLCLYWSQEDQCSRVAVAERQQLLLKEQCRHGRVSAAASVAPGNRPCGSGQASWFKGSPADLDVLCPQAVGQSLVPLDVGALEIGEVQPPHGGHLSGREAMDADAGQLGRTQEHDEWLRSKDGQNTWEPSTIARKETR
jgi:hypothetical protein